MPNNEMMRPLRLKDGTCEILIDAEQVTEAEAFNGMLTIEHEYQEHLHFENMSDKAIMQYFWCAIADALNAPVLATEEVLAGLPKDAKVYTFDEKTGDALRCTFDNEFGWVCRTGHFNEALKLGIPYKIFAINDPKTAEYFRQFTLQGVRRVGNA